MKKLLFLFFTLLGSSVVLSQGGLAAYTDYLRRFYVFDHGKKTLLEEQQVKSFKVGGNCIAYIDYANNFKVYANGRVRTLEIGGVSNYQVTNYLAAYTMNNILKVYDNGRVKALTTALGDYAIGDSLIVYYDEYYNSINGYYRGKVFSQRLRLVGTTIKKIQAGPNIAGLITAENRNFWIFYRGMAHDINQFVEDVQFDVSMDIVSYMDQPTRTFKAFYKNDIYDIENFQPTQVKMGYGRIAYIDVVGNFKSFYDGTIATIMSTPPTFFEVKDSMIVYQELDRFMSFYQGKVTEVAPYMPQQYDFERNIIAYFDRQRNLQIFQNGKTTQLRYGTDVMINDFKVIRDVIVLNVDVNKTLIYYNGKVY